MSNWFDQNYTRFDEFPSKKKLVYLSGKMQGLPDHGFAYFNREASRLRELGYDVINPAENPSQDSWEDYMRIDIGHLVKCDAVAVLDNWRDSRGAQIEVDIAKTLKIPVYTAKNMKPLEEESILEEAERLVNGPRQKSYGHPYDDYTCVADMFNAWMRKKHSNQWLNIDAAEACMFMVFVKLSREGNMTKRDNLVDTAGYIQCYEKILEYEKKKEERKELINSVITPLTASSSVFW